MSADIDLPLWAIASIFGLLLLLLAHYLRRSNLCITDLFTDPTGKLSQSKMWTNIGYATMTAIVWKQGIAGSLTETLALIYLSVVAGSELAKKALEIWKGKIIGEQQGDDNGAK